MLSLLVLFVVLLPLLVRLVVEALHRVLSPRYPLHSRGVVLITGTSTGIGYAAAVDLARLTQFTIFATVRKQSDFDKLRSLGYDNIVPILMDVTEHFSIVKAFDSIKAFMKEHDLPFVGLINNAGLGHGIVTEFYPLAEARHVFNVNYFGVLEITQMALPLLRESRGRIVFISSFAGTNSFPTGSVYCGSKFAVEALADCLRKELFPHQVSVSLMEPAYVKTALQQNSYELTAKVLEEHNVDTVRASHIYPKYFDPVRLAKRREAENAYAAETEEVTKAIHHALTVAQPYPRYRLANAAGLPAWLLIWIFWGLPDSVKDYIFAAL
eukprot:gene7889-8701_t